MGMILGLKPQTLCIRPLGVTVTFTSQIYGRFAECKKILIALAGPMVNTIIILISFFITVSDNMKQTLIYSNLLLIIFNMIPIYPLDGGRILKSLIRLRHNNFDTEKIMNKVSNIFAIFITGVSSIIILYIKNIAIVFILIYLWIILIKENKHYSFLEKINQKIKMKKI